jgi:hypothetical protein
MTQKELGQYYWLCREIQMDEERLVELEAKAASLQSPSLSGMPHGNEVTSKVERYAVEIVDLQAIIAAKRLQCIHERNRLERFIADIPDSVTRIIFTLRCVDKLNWRQVAVRMGGPMTEENAKQLFSRYLKSQQKGVAISENSDSLR